MKRNDELDFKLKPGPRRRGSGSSQKPFLSLVAKAVNKHGPPRRARTKNPPSLSRLGRGHVAAVLSGDSLGPRHRRVVIKTRFINLKRVTHQAVTAHLRYITRDGIGHDGQPSHPYSATLDAADVDAFAAKARDDRHQFRFIVSPEDGSELGDLKSFTRNLMATMEADLGTSLDWVAVDHWDTDNPHTHVVVRGKVKGGQDLINRPQLLERRDAPPGERPRHPVSRTADRA